jgi:hypothetical protein
MLSLYRLKLGTNYDSRHEEEEECSEKQQVLKVKIIMGRGWGVRNVCCSEGSQELPSCPSGKGRLVNKLELYIKIESLPRSKNYFGYNQKSITVVQ